LVEAAYQNEPLLADVAVRYFGPPKPVYISGVMSRLGLSGFYMPFTGEPNFNAAQPDFDLPYVIAHEKAHQRGFAHEDEANFLAFLVCVNSTDPYIRYSGYLNALRVAGAARWSDPAFFKSLFARIGEGPRQDLRARDAFWSRYQGPARAAAERVNDSYLKANRISSGTRNYGEDIALIVGYYLKRTQSDPGPGRTNR
jgi:predicted aminopeptidase